MGNKAIILWDGDMQIVNPDPVGNPPVVGNEEDNAGNLLTYNFWKPQNTGDGGFTMVRLDGVAVDSIGIAGHNMNTQQITFSLEAWDGAAFNSVFAPFIPSSDAPFLKQFTPTIATLNLFRLLTNQPNGGGDTAEIAVARVGPAYTLTQPIGLPMTPTPLAYDDQVLDTARDTRQWGGRFKQFERIKTALRQVNMDPTHARGPWLDFMEHARLNPFFFAWDPVAFPDEVAYCWLSKMQRGRQTGTFLIGSNQEIEGFAS